MKVDGKATRSIWVEADGWSVGVIDQTLLPHRFATARLTNLDDAARVHLQPARLADAMHQRFAVMRAGAAHERAVDVEENQLHHETRRLSDSAIQKQCCV